MTKRNYNIDILRAMSILLIVLYHSWVLSGSAAVICAPITMLVSMGGEIGVTAFFALSGYGIFCSLRNSDLNGGISFTTFMKKRFARILPQYVVCILLYFTVMGGDLFSWSGLKNFVAHIFFVHNFFPNYHGAINGVLWTMGVIVQFYFVAIPLYYAVKKWKGKAVLASICITVIAKFAVYHMLLPLFSEGGQTYYFIYGRQLLTSLDNFVMGMWVAEYLMEGRKTSALWKNWLGVILGIFGLGGVCLIGQKTGVWVDNLYGYTWHTCLVIFLMILGISFARISINKDHIFSRIFLWISHYEYGIYMWHLLVINSILGCSPWIWEKIQQGYHLLVYGIFGVLSILVGYVMSKGFDHVTVRFFKK